MERKVEGKRKTFAWQNPMPYDELAGISPLRDPFILKDGDFWYLTGTLPPYDISEEANRTKGVPLYRSSDLKNWTFIDYIVRTPPESEGKWYSERFWAPELFCHNGRYYVVVNCCRPGDKARGSHGHLFARADRIEGPYEIMNPEAPLRLGNDAHLFVDDDGQVYLFATGIWCARLDLDHLRLLTEGSCPVRPIAGSEAWNGARERVGFEGPYVLKRDGIYYLFYSTWARGYEVGVAVTEHLEGEWRILPDPMYGGMNPAYCRTYGGIYQEGYYQNQDKYRESGHNSVFHGPDGGFWIAAHAYDRESDKVKLVIDKLVPDDRRGMAALDTSLGKVVNGPTWGASCVTYDPAAADSAPLQALDVWKYVGKGERCELPGQVDILLENGMRTCAPVIWERSPDLQAGGKDIIRGRAACQGKSYAVRAHVVLLEC